MKKLLLSILTLGLFNCSQNNKNKSESSEILTNNKGNSQIQEPRFFLSMPMFLNDDKYDIKLVVEQLKSFWGLEIADLEGDNDNCFFNIDNQEVKIFFMPKPIPSAEILDASKFAYNWPTVNKDLKNFTGHAIVSVKSSQKSSLESFSLLTKVIHSILSTSNSVGVYQGAQTLLIPKNQYLESSKSLKSNEIPVDLWVYIGIVENKEGNSVYTYGMGEFGKNEMEIINSKLKMDELNSFIMSMVVYVIENDVIFSNGETIGFTEDQKIPIKLSKAKFVDGQSFKFEL